MNILKYIEQEIEEDKRWNRHCDLIAGGHALRDINRAQQGCGVDDPCKEKQSDEDMIESEHWSIFACNLYGKPYKRNESY
jgi:hypothetical protein